jgi:unsaturated rhamnogalacturonyl hydrolase
MEIKFQNTVFMLFFLSSCGISSGSKDIVSDIQDSLQMQDDAGNEDALKVPYDWCVPDKPPDLLCYREKRNPDSENIALARVIALKQIEDHSPEKMAWNWEEAVMMTGFVELYYVTGDAVFMNYCRKWMDHHIETGYEITSSDTCAPAAIAVALYEQTGEEKYMKVISDAFYYLENTALRTEEGGISHLGVLPLVTLWLDSLFMFGNFLIRWGESSSDTDALALFSKQYSVFASLLQKESGFFMHAYKWPQPQDDNVFWGRGNGWVAASVYEYLRVLTDRGEDDDTAAQSALKLMDAASSAQDKDTGLWWTVLNRPGETYLETSASALFAFAFARAYRYGYLNDSSLKVISEAVKGIKSRIKADEKGRPVITGISGPTGAGTFQNYANIGIEDDLPYGTGAVIMALVETSGLIDSGSKITEIEILPSSSFVKRQKEYLALCSKNNGPGKGGIDGQVCRIEAGESAFNEDAIDSSCEKIKKREDCSDFHVAALLRLLYLDKEHNTLKSETKSRIEETVLQFKYWLDESGKDKMCFWTENHQILYHSNELLAGQIFSSSLFPNADMTGIEHSAHAKPLVLRWLDLRGKFGFSEWHSNVYFNEDIPALVNLADFAEDETIRIKASMVLDILAFDMLNNYYKGYFATVHGRTYEDKLIGGLNDSTSEAVWIMLGLGEYHSAGNFSGSFLATSKKYWPAEILEKIAQSSESKHEHMQRDSINVAYGQEYGIGYENFEDIIFWAGMAAIAAPEVINGTLNMVNAYDLWEGFLFGDLPESLKSILKGMAGTPELKQLSTDLEPVSLGMALETMSTYTYRTPHYQLSGAQNYKPGMWAAQVHAWQATIDQDAYIFTTYPGAIEGFSSSLEFAGQWTGGWLPQATFYRNVGIIQYDRKEIPALESSFTTKYTHAYFPKSGFDTVVEKGNWVMGKKGDGYAALYSQNPVKWSEQNNYELIADSPENVWIVELGSPDENGSFDEFVSAVTNASVVIDDTVIYQSPSRGSVTADREGIMTVNGESVDTCPYPRWKNAYSFQEFGTDKTAINYVNEEYVLDFQKGKRSLYRILPKP